MARYYDMDALADMIRARADILIEGKQALNYIANWLDKLPAADVVPKSESERLKAEIRAYDVAKKCDAEHFMAVIKRLKAENATLITQRDNLLRSYASGIFKEITSCLDYIEEQLDDIPDCFLCVKEDISELKKKYTEVKT